MAVCKKNTSFRSFVGNKLMSLVGKWLEGRKTKNGEPAVTRVCLFDFRVVFQEKSFSFFFSFFPFDDSGRWNRLLVNLSDLIK